MIAQKMHHYVYADFLEYLAHPRSAKSRLTEAHVLHCASCYRGFVFAMRTLAPELR